MRAKAMLIPAFASALFLVSCAAAPRTNVFFDQSTGTFSKETPITIVTPNDITNTKSMLQVALQRKGFRIRSAVAAKSTTVGQSDMTRTVEQGTGYGSVNSLETTEREFTQESQSGSRQSYRKYGSEYLMTLMYVWMKNKDDSIFADDAGNYYFKSFVAEIASQETGEILMSIQYPRSPQGYEQKLLLADLVQRMSQCAAKGRCDERSYQGERVPVGLVGKWRAETALERLNEGD